MNLRRGDAAAGNRHFGRAFAAKDKIDLLRQFTAGNVQSAERTGFAAETNGVVERNRTVHDFHYARRSNVFGPQVNRVGGAERSAVDPQGGSPIGGIAQVKVGARPGRVLQLHAPAAQCRGRNIEFRVRGENRHFLPENLPTVGAELASVKHEIVPGVWLLIYVPRADERTTVADIHAVAVQTGSTIGREFTYREARVRANDVKLGAGIRIVWSGVAYAHLEVRHVVRPTKYVYLVGTVVAVYEEVRRAQFRFRMKVHAEPARRRRTSGNVEVIACVCRGVRREEVPGAAPEVDAVHPADVVRNSKQRVFNPKRTIEFVGIISGVLEHVAAKSKIEPPVLRIWILRRGVRLRQRGVGKVKRKRTAAVRVELQAERRRPVASGGHSHRHVGGGSKLDCVRMRDVRQRRGEMDFIRQNVVRIGGVGAPGIVSGRQKRRRGYKRQGRARNENCVCFHRWIPSCVLFTSWLLAAARV